VVESIATMAITRGRMCVFMRLWCVSILKLSRGLRRCILARLEV
jgi:hypothetical protein